MRVPRQSPGTPLLQLVIGALAVVYCVTLAAQPFIPRGLTASHVIGGIDLAVTVVALLALAVAGVISFGTGLSRPVAIGAVAVAALWLLIVFASFAGASATLHLAAVAARPLAAAAFLNLCVALFVEPSLRPSRAFVAGAWVIAIALAALQAAIYAPFYDVDCLGVLCSDSRSLISVPFAVRHWTSVAVDLFTVSMSAAAGLAAATSFARKARRKAAAMGCLVVAACQLVMPFASGIRPGGGPGTLMALSSIGALVVAGAVIVEAVNLVRVRSGVRGVVEELEAAPPANAIEGALSTAFGDPSIRVAYVGVDGNPVVEGEGRVPGQRSDDGMSSTLLERGGLPVAVVHHSGRSDLSVLGSAAGSSFALALDNGRLDAIALADLEDLRASRLRVIERADSERQRIERDLHDGAQQSLLAVLLRLRVAATAAAASGRTHDEASLRALQDQAASLLDSVRSFARGVYPTVLSQSGLLAAVEALSEDSLIPLEVTSTRQGRDEPTIEHAAYRIIEVALGESAAAGATHLRVEIGGGTEEMIIDMLTDKASPDGPSDRIDDRARAAYGSAELIAGRDGDIAVRVVLPCE